MQLRSKFRLFKVFLLALSFLAFSPNFTSPVRADITSNLQAWWKMDALPTDQTQVTMFITTNATENPSNPLLTYGGVGTFDHGSVRDNMIWYARGSYWTLYTGASQNTTPFNPTIGIASSPDGSTWTKLGQVIPVNPVAGQWNSGAIFSPGVYYDSASDVLYVYVSGTQLPAQWYTGPAKIGVLKVSAGGDWTVPGNYVYQNSGNPILIADQGWEGSQGVYAPDVKKIGSNYVMYYSSSTGASWDIGDATAPSPEGPYSKYGSNPITSTHSAEEAAVAQASDGSFIMLTDTTGGFSGIKVFRTTDTTGITGWTVYSTMLSNASAAWHGQHIGSSSLVQKPDNNWLITYNGLATGEATDARQIGFATLTNPGEVVDSSGNYNTAYLSGAVKPSLVLGQIRNALSFNGTSGYLNSGNGSSLMPSSAVSVSAWVFSPSVAGFQTIYGDINLFGYQLGLSNNNLYFALKTTGNGWVGTPAGAAAAVPLSTWTLATGTYDGSNVRVYVNGSNIASQTVAATGTITYSGGPLGVGVRADLVGYYKGSLDEFRIYSRALASGDVTQLYTYGLTPALDVSSASSITNAAALLGGNIITLGGSSVTQRGFKVYTGSLCSGAPAQTVSENGTFSTGSYSLTASGLSQLTDYSYIAYGINGSSNEGDSSCQVFTTLGAPSVTTLAPTSVTTSTALGNGNITSTGGDTITSCGFKYGLTQADTFSQAASSCSGQYSATISSLNSGTTYYVRAFATNSYGTSYGSYTSFATTGSTQAAVSSTTSSSPPECTAQIPSGDPVWLYEANANGNNSVSLRFTNWQNPVDHFALEYGLESGKYIFAADNIGGNSTNSYDVNSLSTNTTYYFRVRTGNGCAVGSWSNELSVKTLGSIAVAKLQTNEVNLESNRGQTIKESPKTYDLNVKIVDTNQNPIEGATVTLHSVPQTAVTGMDGIAKFTNVEPGNHTLSVAYKNYTGEQSLNLSGNAQEINLKISVEQKNIIFDPRFLGVLGVAAIIILTLTVLLIRARKALR